MHKEVRFYKIIVLLLGLFAQEATSFADKFVPTYEASHSGHTDAGISFYVGRGVFGTEEVYLPSAPRSDLELYTVFSGDPSDGRGLQYTYMNMSYVPTLEHPHLLIYFALAEFSGMHDSEDFIYIEDAMGNKITPCQYYHKAGGTAETEINAGFKQVTGGFVYGWRSLILDLANYINQTVYIRVMASTCRTSCTWTRFYMQFDQLHCVDLCNVQSDITLHAPKALTTYAWHRGTANGPIVGTDSVLSVAKGDVDNYYCTMKGECGEVTLLLAYKTEVVADFDYHADCDGHYKINNKSYIKNPQIYAGQYHPDTLEWRLDGELISPSFELPTLTLEEGKHSLQLHVGNQNFECDSTIEKTLVVSRNHYFTEHDSICKGELPYLWYGQSLSKAGTYISRVPKSTGCDSVRILHLYVYPTKRSDADIQLCDNELPLEWNGQSISASGDYEASFITSLGCDSIAHLHVAVAKTTKGTGTYTKCIGQVLKVNGKAITSAGTYLDTLVNASGCDSIVTITITEKDCTQPGEWGDHPLNPYIGCDTAYSTTYRQIYEKELPTFQWNGIPMNQIPHNDHQDTTLVAPLIKTDFSCDSIATLHLHVLFPCELPATYQPVYYRKE